MKMRNLFLVLGLVFGLLAAGASSAHAAKGVKKKGEHTIKGTVVHIATSTKKGVNHAEITVKVHHHKKKVQTNTTPNVPATNPKAPAVKTPKVPATTTPKVPANPGQTVHHHHHHKFTVTSSTQHFITDGKTMQPTTFAAVHKGSHVAITAKGHHADKIVIHHHHSKKPPASKPAKKVTKK